MTRTLIRAHTLLTLSAGQPAVPDGAVIVEGDTVRRVGPLPELEREGGFDAVVGDPRRHIVLPGFVNGHHHSLRPARIGLRSEPLEKWLVRQRERQIPPLTADQLYDHTLWGTLQFLKSGVTSVLDHYGTDPRLEDMGVPPAVQAYVDSGVRAAVCLACADQQRYVYEHDEAFLKRLPADLAVGLRPKIRPFDQEAFFTAWERLAAQFDGRASRIRLGFGASGPQWCSDDLLSRIRRTADDHDGAPVQIHLVESPYQAMYGYRRYGVSTVEHLARIGFFGPATSGAHGVWVGANDIRVLADRGAVIVHNPSSNLVLFNGIAPVADLLDGGVKVGFGLDAAGLNDTMDYLTDLRLGALLQRRPGWDRRLVTAADMLEMATHGGADAMGMGSRLGKLEPGYYADLALVDRTRLYGSPYISPHATVDETLLRRATVDDVEHVMVGGRLVIQDRKAAGIDEVALERRVRASLEATYELLNTADAGFEGLEPAISAFYRTWETESAAVLPPNYVYNTR